MAQKFILTFTIGSRKDDVFLDRHGCQHVEFEVDNIPGLKDYDQSDLWHKVGEILLDKSRRLNFKQDDLFMSILTKKNDGEEGSILISSLQTGGESAGINILLQEISRLRRELVRRTPKARRGF